MSAKRPKDLKVPVDVNVPTKAWGWANIYCPHCRKSTHHKLCETIPSITHVSHAHEMKRRISKFQKCDTCGNYYRVAATRSKLIGKK